MLRITKGFQLNIVRRYAKPALEVLQAKIDQNYVSKRYAEALQKFESKIHYNSVLAIQKVRLRKLDEIVGKKERKRLKNEKTVVEPLPLALNQLFDNAVTHIEEDQREIEIQYRKRYQKTVLPFSRFLRVENAESTTNEEETEENRVTTIKRQIPKNWLQDYEMYDEADDELHSEYGTPDIYHPVTNVPCYGCGALLHCKE